MCGTQLPWNFQSKINSKQLVCFFLFCSQSLKISWQVFNTTVSAPVCSLQQMKNPKGVLLSISFCCMSNSSPNTGNCSYVALWYGCVMEMFCNDDHIIASPFRGSWFHAQMQNYWIYVISIRLSIFHIFNLNILFFQFVNSFYVFSHNTLCFSGGSQ